MYTFHLTIEIALPREKVVKLYTNRALYKHWQPGLLSDEKLPVKQGQPQHKLTYKGGRRKLVMTETILRDDLPAAYDQQFDLKGITNILKNKFEARDNQTTIWTSEVEYRFKGLKNLIATYLRSGFEKQSMIIMKNFKGFAESYSKQK